MTANRRSTAWPLSDMCNVTANQPTGQLSAVQSGVNCSMEDKVIVAVCVSRSSLYDTVEDSACLKGRGEKIKRAHSGQQGAPPADTVAFLT